MTSTEIDAALHRIAGALDAGWRPEISYALESGWRCHIVRRGAPSRCARTSRGRTLAEALMLMEQYVVGFATGPGRD